MALGQAVDGCRRRQEGDRQGKSAAQVEVAQEDVGHASFTRSRLNLALPTSNGHIVRISCAISGELVCPSDAIIARPQLARQASSLNDTLPSYVFRLDRSFHLQYPSFQCMTPPNPSWCRGSHDSILVRDSRTLHNEMHSDLTPEIAGTQAGSRGSSASLHPSAALHCRVLEPRPAKSWLSSSSSSSFFHRRTVSLFIFRLRNMIGTERLASSSDSSFPALLRRMSAIDHWGQWSDFRPCDRFCTLSQSRPAID